MRLLFALALCLPFALGATCDHQTELRPVGGAATSVDAGVDSGADAPSADVASDATDDTGVDRCDLSGVWGVRQVAFNQDTILGAVQTSSEWYIVTVRDDGDTFVVTSSHECGVEVSGSASVVLVPEAIPTVMDANPWDARTGTFVEQGERCGFTIEPWYTVQGANREAYLLTEPAYPTLDEQVAALPLPDAEHPEGAEDWDGDGVPGVAYRVSGAVNGRRNVVQRYWYQYFSSEGFTVPLGSTEFAVRAEFEAEESLIAVEGCDPFCGLLSTGSIVAPGYEHRAWFRRLGDDEADAAGRGEVIVADDRLESCFRLQEFMPHDPDEAEHRGIE